MRVLLLAAVAALLAWWAWPQLQSRLPRLDTVASVAQPAAPPVRCRAPDGKLHYRQGRCADGERQEAMKGGTVNVVAATPTAAASTAASNVPALRQLADPEGTAELQRKRMEALTK